jgi:hypothetical protein
MRILLVVLLLLTSQSAWPLSIYNTDSCYGNFSRCANAASRNRGNRTHDGCQAELRACAATCNWRGRRMSVCSSNHMFR